MAVFLGLLLCSFTANHNAAKTHLSAYNVCIGEVISFCRQFQSFKIGETEHVGDAVNSAGFKIIRSYGVFVHNGYIGDEKVVLSKVIKNCLLHLFHKCLFFQFCVGEVYHFLFSYETLLWWMLGSTSMIVSLMVLMSLMVMGHSSN